MENKVRGGVAEDRFTGSMGRKRPKSQALATWRQHWELSRLLQFSPIDRLREPLPPEVAIPRNC
jgi:hypothetical protein